MTARSMSPHKSPRRNVGAGRTGHASMDVIVNSDKKADSVEGLSRNNLYCDYGQILKNCCENRFE